MKRIVLLIATIIFSVVLLKAQQGIGVTNPDASSALEISSTTKGLLMPRMTTAQMNAIAAPANGLMIYNTTDSCVYIRRVSSWISTCSPTFSMSWSLLGNTGTTAGTNFIGTTDGQDLVFKANNTEAMRITNGNRYIGIGTTSPFTILSNTNTNVADFSGRGSNINSTLLWNSTGGAYGMIVNNADVTGTGSAIMAKINSPSNNAYAFLANVAGTDVFAITGLGRVGINKNSPLYKLDIDAQTGSAGDPLRLLGLNAGATSDSIISSNSGVLRRLSINQILGNAWTITGNAGTVDGTNFIGTTDNVPLSFRMNNIKAGRIEGTTGTNTSIGYQSGNAISTGVGNTTMGFNSLRTGTTNSHNVAIGSYAMETATGDYNVAIGRYAMPVSTASSNIAVGYSALLGNTTGNGLVAVGNSAAKSNTTGTNNTAIGYNALLNSTTSSYNTALGSSTLINNTTGGYNTALGHWALYGNTTGSDNIGIGPFTLQSNLIGNQNTAIGRTTLNVATGDRNVGVGYSAGTRLTTGTDNLLLGNQSGNYITTGSSNIILGYQSGSNLTTGSNNTLIGVGANVTPVSGAALTNATAIGYNAFVNASNSMVLGGTGANAVNIGINTIAPQYKLDIDAQTGSAGNPLRLLGLNAGATSDSIISSNSGVLRRLSINQILGNAWTITGNAGTVDGTNFIGTTDNIPLSIKVNNQKAGRIDHLLNNVTLGYQAGNVNTGPSNTFIGHQTGLVNTTGANNVAIGSTALTANTTGSDHVAIGVRALNANTTSNYNNAVGYEALGFNTTGSYNNAFGAQTLRANTTASYNTAFGGVALSSNTTGDANTASGYAALYSNTTGINNVASGFNALFANTSGNYNVAMGSNALNGNTTGTNNVAYGANALWLNTIGSNNTAVGTQSLYNNTTAGRNVTLGYQALLTQSFNNAGVAWNSDNVAIGYQALFANQPIASAFSGTSNVAVGNLSLRNNTVGYSNAAVGHNAMNANTTGYYQVALGESALAFNTTGNYNTAIGRAALYANVTGNNNTALGANALGASTASDNIAIGYSAMYTNTTGATNVVVGNSSLYSNTTGNNNVLVGHSILINSTNKSNNTSVGDSSLVNAVTDNNTALGYKAGASITSGGGNNTFIGASADASVSSVSNATAIGYNAIVGASNSLVLGGTGANAVSVGINTTTPQYKLDINAQTGSAGNPLRLLGLNAGATSDSIISSNSGILRRLSINQILANAWTITGNAGTTAGTNFIGTTDAQSLVFKTNNAEGMRLNTSGYLGIGTTTPSVQLDVVGKANIQTASTFNLFINGGNTAATGTYNTVTGINAMTNLTTGGSNDAFGAGALNGLTTGSNNTAMGGGALYATTTGSSNTALGNQALLVNTGGIHNVGLGVLSLSSNTTGNQNTGVGSYTLSNLTNGSNNIALGWGSGDNLTTGSDNIIIGYQIKAPSATGSGQLNIGNLLYGTSLGSSITPSTGNIGINTTTPQYKLDIDAMTRSAGNPLRLLGLNAGAISDSIISSNSGVLRRLSVNQLLANAWNTTGNAGTTAGTNFIGTTDAQDLAFKTNNTEGMRLNTTGHLGITTTTPTYKIHIEDPSGADADIASRVYNTNVLTYQPSLMLQTSGGTKAAATAVANTTMLGVIRWGGYDGSAFNDIQCAEIGALATEAWTPSAHGTSLNIKTIPNASTIALSRLFIDQNGYTGIGTMTPNQQLEITAAMRMPATTSSTTGVIYKDANRFIHNYKPAANDGNNTFVGVNAGNFTMASATSWLASGNTGMGTNALTALVGGGFNTAVGLNALTANTSGSYNLAVGSLALAANTTGAGNTAVGHNALPSNNASSNTAVGNGAMFTNTSGTANVAVGETALNKNTTGNQNTAIGQSTMRDNTTGSNNTAVGISALQANTTGASNTALGNSALVTNLIGNNNVALGYSALSATTSSNNVSIGYGAGTGTTSGGNNTFVGYNTGLTNTTGTNNTFLGYQANVSSAALTNATAIGNGATVNANNKIRLGNTSVTLVETSGSFVTVSDKRLKTNIYDNHIGLDFIKAVRPVNYELKTQKGVVYDGFIAQEIDSIMLKQGIKTFSGLSKPENTEGGYYTVSYATFVVPLVNAIKELDTKAEELKMKSEELSAENALLKAELEKIKAENAALKASVDKNTQDIEAIKAALNKKQN